MEFFNPLYSAAFDYPPRAPEAVLVVASSPRSGSTRLGSLLQQTGVLGFPLEYHASANIAQMAPRMGTGDAIQNIICARTSPNGVFSFKTHWVKSHERVIASIRDLPRRYVRIRRRDLAAQAASLVKARATGNYLNVEGLRGAAKPDPITLQAAVDTIHKAEAGWESYLQMNSFEPLTVWYEDDLLVDAQAAVDRIADFMAVERKPIDATQVPVRMQRSSA